jgi:hypothetical protein
VLGGAQSKDPDSAPLLVLFGAFQPPQPVCVRYAYEKDSWEGFTAAYGCKRLL